MHKAQVFCYLLIAFLAGTAAATFNSNNIWALVLIIIGTIVVVVSSYNQTFARSRRAEFLRRLGVLIGGLLLVFAVGAIRYDMFSSNHGILHEFASRQVKKAPIVITLDGYVDGEVSSTNGSLQFPFHVVSLTVPGRTVTLDEETLATASANKNYTFGQKLELNGPLALPQNTTDFDYVQYLRNQGMETVMTASEVKNLSDLKLPWTSDLKIAVYKPLLAIKNYFENSISRALPATEAAYMNGVLLGTRSAIPKTLKDDFSRTSTSHILAISGYNITIIADALLAVLVVFMRRRRAFWLSVAVILAFTVLTGASASVVRAAIMGLLLLYANGYGRLYDARNSILAAAAVMVWFNPFILRFDVGFQLSFLAVLGLIYVYPILKRWTDNWPDWAGLKETLLMTLAAQIAVAPLIVYVFNQFSLVSLPANILVLPLMPYVMLFGFLTGIGGLIALPLGKALGLIALVLARYQLSVISWLAGLPGAAISVALHWLTLVIIYLLLATWVWKMSPKTT
ncbi:MAG TPA: ComEC/Rec2 family competence protein [Candidatus Paceibacterota bacterium]|nr:ComEC/Rec2 family competence protein [Candidatus Paceibacterota bacterium]